MALEYEWKFRAEEAVLFDIDAAFSGQRNEIAMETTYYDTPSGALSALRYTLRRRFENGVSVCTLKAPAGNARGEWETECDRIEDAVPQLVALGCPQNLPELIEEGLIPICGAKFTRIAKAIILSDAEVELALDKGKLLGGNREESLCEVEVELKSGSNDACDHFAAALAVRFDLKPEPRSKFRRALTLYKGE